jgi:hypothetical protein
MIKAQLRELRVRLDQMERIALAIPTEYWPDAFDAVLESWKVVVGMAPSSDEALSDEVGGNVEICEAREPGLLARSAHHRTPPR